MAAGGGAHNHDVTVTDRVLSLLPPPARGVAERAREGDVLVYASSLAFYALVSLAPVVVLSLWLMGVVAGDEEVKKLAATLKDLAPRKLGADRALTRVAELGTKIGIPAVVAALWPATAYGAGLKRAFEHVSPRRRSELRGVRGRALAFLVLLPLFVLGALVGSYAGTTVLGNSVPATLLGWVLALAGAFAFVAVATAVVYRVYAPETFGRGALARGAAACAAGVSLLSLAFTIYLRSGADFQSRYATSGLAAIVLLAVWLFLTNVLLLVGYKIALESE